MAEGARLESVYTGNRIVGSNPTPSATVTGLRHHQKPSRLGQDRADATGSNKGDQEEIAFFGLIDVADRHYLQSRDRRRVTAIPNVSAGSRAALVSQTSGRVFPPALGGLSHGWSLATPSTKNKLAFEEACRIGLIAS